MEADNPDVRVKLGQGQRVALLVKIHDIAVEPTPLLCQFARGNVLMVGCRQLAHGIDLGEVATSPLAMQVGYLQDSENTDRGKACSECVGWS